MANCKECIHYEVCRALCKSEEELMPCVVFKYRSHFVELPCKVGDTIYWNIFGRSVEDKITNITIYENVIRVFLKKGISFDIEDIGRMIFLTREEAERALKEREKHEEI